MVFKRILGSLGLGGPSVDTVLSTAAVAPGQQLTGNVTLRGGAADVEIESIVLILASQTGQGIVESARFPVAGRIAMPAKSSQSVPFNVTLPWETPFTSVYGQPLPGITAGLRTEVSVSRSSDKTDLDPVVVAALPVHQAILDALGTLGCRFIRTDLRHGAEVGLPAPYAQRLVFYPPATVGYAHLPQLSFTLAANPHAVDIAVETVGGPQDRYTVGHDSAGPQLEQAIDGWVKAALAKVPAPPAGAAFLHGTQRGPGIGHRPYDHSQVHHGQIHHGPGHGSHRPGVGAAVGAGLAAGALGFLGGMAVNEMLDGDSAQDQPDASANLGDFDSGGGFGGGDFGGDFGGGDFGGGDFGGGDFGGGE